MVSEKPPRRSKAEKEPVTIDLTAEESEAVAEPVRANDTDEPLTPAEQAAEASENAEASGGTGEPAKSEAEDAPARAPFAADEPAAGLSAAEEPPFDTETTAEAPPQPESATVAPEPEPAAAPRQRPSPAISTLIASGIFGGIVALLLAGSMQYAGYLPGATPAPAPASDTSALSSEIAALRQEIEGLRNQPAIPDASLADRVQTLESAASQNASGDLQQRLTALESQINDVKSATETTAASDAELARRLEQAEERLNDRGPEQQVARAVAAAALKSAIDRGGAFETELQTFASVAADDPAIAELQKFAATGVPSNAELQREFPPVADAMLEATAPTDPNQGIAGRLLSSAMSVVKVRRVGDVEGETPEAIVARLEEGLRKGDLQTAAREWDALPEPAKTVSRDFRQKLDARIQVENLVGGTLTRAVAGTQG